MLTAFTKNYKDNSTDAGFQFTFFCDVCNDGFKSSFIESTTYKKQKSSKLFGQAANLAGSFLGGRASQIGNTAERGGNILSQTHQGQTPAWHKEHEQAFDKAQNEQKKYFHRCPNCNTYVCDHCWNEDATLCTKCAPRQEVMVGKAHADAMKRNIDAAGQNATVWQGTIEQKTTICPACGKPAGQGKFCNNCGASMDLKECPKCGAKNALTIRFCNNCGNNLAEAAAPPAGKCADCGFDNPPGTKFCGDCGKPL